MEGVGTGLLTTAEVPLAGSGPGAGPSTKGIATNCGNSGGGAGAARLTKVMAEPSVPTTSCSKLRSSVGCAGRSTDQLHVDSRTW